MKHYFYCIRNYAATFLLLFSLIFSGFSAFGKDNSIQCIPVDGRMQCQLQLHDFIRSIGEILSNGWENKLFFDIFLINDSGETVRRSSLSASQRCYIDPFESPCLLLWSGSDSWQQYRDSQALERALTLLKRDSQALERALTLLKIRG